MTPPQRSVNAPKPASTEANVVSGRPGTRPRPARAAPGRLPALAGRDSQTYVTGGESQIVFNDWKQTARFAGNRGPSFAGAAGIDRCRRHTHAALRSGSSTGTGLAMAGAVS